MAVVQVLFTVSSGALVPAEITLFVWAAIAFAAVPALQIGVVSQARDAPNLASTLNIGAFNVGNALGASAGGMVIAQGAPLHTVPLAGAALALVGLVLAVAASRSAVPVAATVH